MASILWIDDKAGQSKRRMLGFDGVVWFLRKEKHDVDVVNDINAVGALDSIGNYDLIILDIIMETLSGSKHSEGKMGGLDVLEYIQKCKIKCRVIILSVVKEEIIIRGARKRGVDMGVAGVKRILRKGSLRPSRLAAVVNGVLTGKETGR